MSKLGKKSMIRPCCFFGKKLFSYTITKAASSAIEKFDRKIIGVGVVRARKWFTIFFSNEDRKIKIHLY